METCGIIWIEFNDDKILKSRHKNVFNVFSFFKGLEMLSK
jgi:hypothetical protein